MTQPARSVDAVMVSVRRCVDDAWPGLVECSLVDTSGREWLFIEKAPVVTGHASLGNDDSYPQPGIIACLILAIRSEASGPRVATISTERPWDVESTTGHKEFQVLYEQLTKVT